MTALDERIIRKQIREVCRKKFDFWLVNCKNDYRNLRRFFNEVELPDGAEVFTSEMVYPGVETEECLGSFFPSCGSAPPEETALARERNFLFKLAVSGNSVSKEHPLRAIFDYTRKKRVGVWLGLPYKERVGNEDVLRNAYVLIKDGRVRFVHRKKFLWDGEDSEVGIFDVGNRVGRIAVSTPRYDGIFKNRAHLICYEADMFFCPKWRKKPSHIPEVRDAKPDFVIIPAHWLEGAEIYLRKLSLSIARRIKEPRVDCYSAVRENGCIVLVVNYNAVYACGPVDEKKIKARVYACQPNRGWLRIGNNGVSVGEF